MFVFNLIQNERRNFTCAQHLYDFAETLTVSESNSDVVVCDDVIRALIQQPEKLALRSLKLAVAYCPMTSDPVLYTILAFKAPLLHTLDLGCKRAPITANSVYAAIKRMENLCTLKLHLTWVRLLQHTDPYYAQHACIDCHSINI
jgi:hypothetical protein